MILKSLLPSIHPFHTFWLTSHQYCLQKGLNVKQSIKCCFTWLGTETLLPVSAGLQRGLDIPDKESCCLQIAWCHCYFLSSPVLLLKQLLFSRQSFIPIKCVWSFLSIELLQCVLLQLSFIQNCSLVIQDSECPSCCLNLQSISSPAYCVLPCSPQPC